MDFYIENGELKRIELDLEDTHVIIPDSVTRIGENVFRWCQNLTNVIIPNGVTSIGHEAFQGCTSLTDITIPDSVTSFGERVFQNCINLAGFTIRNANIVIQIPESVRLIA